MKILKALFSTLLSVILTAAILLTCVLHVTGGMLKKDALGTLVKEAKVGEKILAYTYDEDKGIEKDFFEALNSRYQVQSALAVGIYGEEAEICQQGAIDYVKGLHDQDYAYSTLDQFSEDLATGYVQTAVEHGFIDPNEWMTYKNVRNERVNIKKGDLLLETMNTKYYNLNRTLISEGFFCALSLGERQDIVYLLKTGKEAEEIEDGFRHAVEDEVGDIYSSQLLSFMNSLNEDSRYEQVSEDRVKETVTKVLYSYLNSIGISDERVRDHTTELNLDKSVSSFIYPKLAAYLPSYQSTVDALPKIALTGLRLLNNSYLFYGALALCVLLVFLIIGSAGKGTLGFTGLAALLSGGALFIAKFFRTRIVERCATVLGKTVSSFSLIVPDLLSSFITQISRVGLYVVGAGLVLLLLAILFLDTRKRA